MSANNDGGATGFGIIQGIVVVIVIAGFIFGIMAWILSFGNEAMDGMFTKTKSLSESNLTPFSDQVVDGSQVKNLISTEGKSGLGIIVFTRKNTSGVNYGRPLAEASATSAAAPTVLSANGTAKGAFEVKLASAKDYLDKVDVTGATVTAATKQEETIPGVFASDDKSISYSSLRWADKSGHKDQIVDNARFHCKKITDNNTPVGVACAETK